jgi:hypothetical protein
MLKRLIVALLALTLAACSSATPTPTATPEPTAPPLSLEDEEAAVYAAVLAWNYPGEMYVLMGTTDISASAGPDAISALDCAQECLPGVADETIENFQTRNISVSPLRRTMDLGAPYFLMSMDARRTLFDADLDQALVYASMESSTSSAEGSFFLLEKVGQVWTVVARLILWSF